MKSFAAIYIPHLEKTFCFEEASAAYAEMYLENFGASRRINFRPTGQSTFPEFLLVPSAETSTLKESYETWVKTAIQQIETHQFSKIVCAQNQAMDFPGYSLDFYLTFQNLILALPNTFVYVIYIDSELWIGASPEIIGIWTKNVFSTISLAGTQKENNFTLKEREEQAIVSDYITSHFNQIKDKTYKQTQTLNYGTIQHLISKFSWPMDSYSDFEIAIQTIHPSPALAGMPKEKSVEFILKNEPIKRNFYTGLVSINFKTSAYSFAMIRCAKITENQLVFYAGAGITKDSRPGAEWEETLEKIDVLKKAMRI